MPPLFGKVADNPRCLPDVSVQALFGNPAIPFNGKTIYSLSIASNDIRTVGYLLDCTDWKPIIKMLENHDVGPNLMKLFVPQLWRAIPLTWLSLPDMSPEPATLTISPSGSAIDVVAHGLYRKIAIARDIQPMAMGQWGKLCATVGRWLATLLPLNRLLLFTIWIRSSNSFTECSLSPIACRFRPASKHPMLYL